MLSKRQYKASCPPFGPEQAEILYRMLLGDAHSRHKYRDASIEFGQSGAQRAFIEHLFEVFRPYTWMDAPRTFTYRHRVRGTLQTSCTFSTFSHPVFTPFYGAFYRRSDPHRWVKRISEAVEEWLTPRVMAYHVMCDGSLDRRCLTLATDGFSGDDCERYATALRTRFDLSCCVIAYTKGGRIYPRIRFFVRGYPRVRDLLASFTLPMFHYKLGFGAV